MVSKGDESISLVFRLTGDLGHMVRVKVNVIWRQLVLLETVKWRIYL